MCRRAGDEAKAVSRDQSLGNTELPIQESSCQRALMVFTWRNTVVQIVFLDDWTMFFVWVL